MYMQVVGFVSVTQGFDAVLGLTVTATIETPTGPLTVTYKDDGTGN